MSQPFAVIVDAYSTGAELAPKFSARGIPSIHVQSAASVPPSYVPSFQPDSFPVSLPHSLPAALLVKFPIQVVMLFLGDFTFQGIRK